MTRGHHERLLDIISAGFDIVTATDISVLATCGDLSATPALEIVRVVELGVERKHCYCKQNLRIVKVSEESYTPDLKQNPSAHSTFAI